MELNINSELLVKHGSLKTCIYFPSLPKPHLMTVKKFKKKKHKYTRSRGMGDKILTSEKWEQSYRNRKPDAGGVAGSITKSRKRNQ